jgi:hypothetical protein
MSDGDSIDPATLEPGHRYRVDHKDARLRRSFRFDGTFLGSQERTQDGVVSKVLVFEVKPRFGKPAHQPVDPATITSIEPA